MDLEIYSKDPPSSNSLSLLQRTDRYFYTILTIIGLASILFALWPYLVWQVSTMPKLTSHVKNVPVPQSKVLSASTSYAENIQVVKDSDGFSYFATTYKPQGQRPKEFYVTIPKLKIFKAIAKVDSLNFKQNLSHFPGSALPGEVGNVFITG